MEWVKKEERFRTRVHLDFLFLFFEPELTCRHDLCFMDLYKLNSAEGKCKDDELLQTWRKNDFHPPFASSASLLFACM